MYYFFTWLYLSLLRPLTKVILRKITKMCELQRICYSIHSGALRCMQVEKSLMQSKQPQIREIITRMNKLCEEQNFRKHMDVSVNLCVVTVLKCKLINPKIHTQFIKSFSCCLHHIWGYEQLLIEIQSSVKIPYNSEDEEHEKKLLQLWNLLNPNTPLSKRQSKQWQNIGFQGTDPKTDFRGMGILGLDNLIFLAREYNNIARAMLQHSLHPTKGYTFAILGINMTHLAYNLMVDYSAKTHFFNLSHSIPTIDTFHYFYSYLFIEFDKFWIASNPTNIMDFSRIRNGYELMIRRKLQKSDCIFNFNNVINV